MPLQKAQSAILHAFWQIAALCGLASVCHAQTPTIIEYPLPVGSAASFYSQITAGPDGALWFTETSNNKIGRITTAGVITEFTLPTPQSSPFAITSGPDGAIWFTEFAINRIGRLTPSFVFSDYALPQGGCPSSIAPGPDGAVWFVQSCGFGGGGLVGRISTAGVITGYPIAAPITFNSVTNGPDGALWFLEYGQVDRITTTGIITNQYPIPGVSCITLGPDGALWFAIGGDPNISIRVGRLTTGGAVTLFTEPTSPCFNGVTTIITGPDGALWYITGSCGGGPRIGRVTTAGAFTPSVVPGNHPINFYGLAAGPDGNIWFLEPDAIGVIVLNATAGPPVTTSQIAGPAGNNGWYLGAVTVTLSATSRGNSVASTHFSIDGGAYQTYSSPFSVSGDGAHQLSFYSVDTAGHQETAQSQTIRIDSSSPSGHVSALPAIAATPSFTVQWSGSDAVSGIAAFTIYVSDNGGPFAPWLSGTTATQATYSGVAGHSYGFYSIATDIAGNREFAKTAAEAVTTVPVRPVSHVSTLPPLAPSANFTVQWSGTAPGSGIASYTIYVSDNGGAFTSWLSATTLTQSTYSGACGHSYGFYSIATNALGIQELPKTAAEAVTRAPSVPVSHVAALPATGASPNFNVQWSGSDACSTIKAFDVYVSDNRGAFTLWISQTTATQAYYSGLLGHTYGFYSIAISNSSSQEAPKSAAEATTQVPAQMAADVNGDMRIDCTDVSILNASIGKKAGQPGFDARADVNSDGLVDVRDLAIVTQKLAPGTKCP
jgi:virginiamycin B lyase